MIYYIGGRLLVCPKNDKLSPKKLGTVKSGKSTYQYCHIHAKPTTMLFKTSVIHQSKENSQHP